MAHVMIVDDDDDFAAATARVLRQTGHEVQIELDTAEAMTSMTKRRPDLVILDVMFPENASAGFELARTMRHCTEDLKDVPVLLLTALNMKFPLGFSSDDIGETSLPVSDFLEKPVDFNVLRKRVAKLLAKAPEADASGRDRT